MKQILTAFFQPLFLGFMISLEIFAFQKYLGVDINYTIILVGFLVTSFIYLLNKFSDKEDATNNPDGWKVFNTKWIKILFCCICIGSIVIIPFIPKEISLFISIIILIGVLYSIPMPLTKIRLKNIIGLKNLVVCLIWAFFAITLAASVHNINIFRIDLIFIIIMHFIGNCNSAITCDVRDIKGDREQGIKTIANVLGIKATFRLLSVINTIGFVIISIFYISSGISTSMCIYACLYLAYVWVSIVPQYFNRFNFYTPYIHNWKSATADNRQLNELLVDSYLIIFSIFILMS